MKKRKLIFLMDNGRVEKSKHPMSHPKSIELLRAATLVLIPVNYTSATYIAVDAATILDRPFDRATVQYQMAFYNRSVFHAIGDEEMEYRMRYHVVTMEISTVEDLYNVIFNILSFYLVDEMNCMTDSDFIWTMAIESCDIRLYQQGQRVDQIIYDRKEDQGVPWVILPTEVISQKLMDHFGVVCHNNSDYFGKVLVCDGEGSSRRWKVLDSSRAKLSNSLDFVACPCVHTGSFVLTPVWTYKSLERARCATLSLECIDIYTSKHKTEIAPIAHYLGLPVYRWEPVLAEGSSSETIGEFLCKFDSVPFSFSLTDFTDIIVYLDSLHYILQIYQEGNKVRMALTDSMDDMDRAVDSLADRDVDSTVLCTIACDIACRYNTPSEDEPLLIFTDCFEDELPNLEQLAYVIELKPY